MPSSQCPLRCPGDKLLTLVLALVCFTQPQSSQAQEAKHRASLRGQWGCIGSVKFSPDGKILASGGVDNPTLLLWDVATWKRKATLRAKDNEILCLAFSADGNTIASGGYSKLVRLWDVATGKKVAEFTEGYHQTHALLFSADGRSLICAGDDGLGIWQIATKQRHTRQLRQCDCMALHGTTSLAESSVLSRDGNDLDISDVATGKKKQTLIGSVKYFDAVAFTPDGKSLAVGGSLDAAGSKGAITLWDTGTSKERWTVRTNSMYIFVLAFTSDGKLLAAGDLDANVTLWDVATGKRRGAIARRWGQVTSMTFSPDGKTLAFGTMTTIKPQVFDDTVEIWDISEFAQTSK